MVLSWSLPWACGHLFVLNGLEGTEIYFVRLRFWQQSTLTLMVFSCCQCAQKPKAMGAPTEGAQNRCVSHVID